MMVKCVGPNTGFIGHSMLYYSGMKQSSPSYYNWSTDETALKKAGKFEQWKLEQQINYGLRGSKISRSDLKRYWSKLSLDPLKAQYFEFLLWGRLPKAFSPKSKRNF